MRINFPPLSHRREYATRGQYQNDRPSRTEKLITRCSTSRFVTRGRIGGGIEPFAGVLTHQSTFRSLRSLLAE